MQEQSVIQRQSAIQGQSVIQSKQKQSAGQMVGQKRNRPYL